MIILLKLKKMHQIQELCLMPKKKKKSPFIHFIFTSVTCFSVLVYKPKSLFLFPVKNYNTGFRNVST